MMFKRKSLLLAVLAAVLFVMSAIPAAAADDRRIVIRLKVGSAQMTINGEAIKIVAPYKSGGTVMVPLSVFTNAKGLAAKLQLKNNKTITLTYQKQTLVMTIGSKSATLNGKKLELPVAPVVKSGVTTAPLAVVAKSLGAKLTTDAATKELVITATIPAPVSADPIGDGLSINPDAGKSKIGDSYFKWSMNYPTGLAQTETSPDGDRIIFQDVKEEYFLGIFIKETNGTLTADETRKEMQRYFDSKEKLLDRSTVKSADKSYERMVSKDSNGFFYEYRGMQANGFLYVLVFGKKAKAAAELERFAPLLNSFKTSFSRYDRSLKDLTQIVEGFKTFTDEDYGLSVKLPKEWTRDEDYGYPWYDADDAYMYMKVSSIEPGDTLDAWIGRLKQRYNDAFAAAYRKDPVVTDIVWNGIPAKQLKLSYSNDTQIWWDEYDIVAVQGKYRYYVEMAWSQEVAAQYGNVLEVVLSSTRVDFATVEGNFGYIPDENDLMDRTTKVTKTSRKYGYSISLPEYWTGLNNDFESDEVLYSHYGGHFYIGVAEDVTDPQLIYAAVDKNLQDEMSKNAKFKVIENTMVTFGGRSAKKVVTEDTANLSAYPYRDITYYVWNNNKFYMVSGTYYLGNATEVNIRNTEAALNSFAFTG